MRLRRLRPTASPIDAILAIVLVGGWILWWTVVMALLPAVMCFLVIGVAARAYARMSLRVENDSTGRISHS